MDKSNVTPGDIVVTNFNFYQHWSIVSDRKCQNGHPMLISATERNGTVKEEPWETVTQGKATYRAQVTHESTGTEIIEKARSMIDKWEYSVLSNNCEHFINWASGLKFSSKQVTAGLTGAVLGAGIVGMCSEKPNLAKFLGGAIALGGLAVLTTRAVEAAKE